MHDSIVRRRWILTGVVQGVGFRPHVARMALRFAGALTGFCGNDSLSVFIEAQGEPAVLDGFLDAVLTELPPLAFVVNCNETVIDVVDEETGFRIVSSRGATGARTLIPPDVSLCADCLADIRDPNNRRYGYAFTTCTNCGPRLSIIEDLPYDRPQTTMRDFPLCSACEAEYRDPNDRRFHAQPISCYDCGPHLWLVEASELPEGLGDPFANQELPAGLVDGTRGGRTRTEQDAVLDAAAAVILAGGIVAVKGIGGFHLVVDATNETAVARLRQRKHRDGKPLAVMVPDLLAARRLVDLGAPCGPVEKLIDSPAHPIVLAERLEADNPVFTGAADTSWPIAPSVAPGLDTLGIMLAYTPLHLLLLERIGRPVVATSGNLSNEPLCYTNQDALLRLGGIADAFLLHNRGIAVPVEDSVMMVAKPCLRKQDEKSSTTSITVGGAKSSLRAFTAGRTEAILPVRRSRGYVPLPFPLAGDDALKSRMTPHENVNHDNPVVLGVGGELKNTFTLVRDGLAFTSAHIGDMGSLASQQAYQKAIAQLTKIHDQQPTVLVHDKHPNYATTAWAERYAAAARSDGREVELMALQHHRAHAFSLLAETGASRAVVISVDGTGYGDDGKIWGSEIFLVDVAAVMRSQPKSTAAAGTEPSRDTGAAAAPRLAHLPYFPLPGADLAVKEPWRQAAALLRSWGVDTKGLPLQARLNTPVGKTVLSQVDAGISPVSCALGRYFDAASAILDLCPLSDHEAAAPVALQTAAQRWLAANPREATAVLENLSGHCAKETTSAGSSADKSPVGNPGGLELSLREIITELVEGMRAGREPGELAFRFHVVLAKAFANTTVALCREHQCAAAGITGGSALNSLLTQLIAPEINRQELAWLTHQQIPANDGGLSLGQAFFGYLATL